MFAKIILVAFALFAVAFAAPGPRPQFIVPGVSAYNAYSSPLINSAPLAYSGLNTLQYSAYSGYPTVYGGGYQTGAVLV